ncbi:hypothetical protein V5O48_007904 [Marasmius crinis-equi]|uniref:F-box domain-containing protein n=1 Tax=Marasmius crinis-equi TaxID=585013 RepID=A0ABR3FFS7_9AGAR
MPSLLSAGRLPPELWYRVFSHLPPQSLRTLIAFDPEFGGLVVPFLHVSLDWRRYFDFLSDYSQSWADRQCSGTVRTVTLGESDRRKPRCWSDDMAWDFTNTFSALSTFSNIGVLALVNVRYPVHQLPHHLASMPRVRDIHLVFHNGCCAETLPIGAVSRLVLPQTFPPLEYLEVRGFPPYQSLPQHTGFVHAGTATLAAVSCLPSIRTLDLDLHSWDSLAIGRSWLPSTSTLAPLLQHLQLFRDASDEAHEVVTPEDWVKTFFNEISLVAANLIHLHVVIGTEVHPPDDTPHLSFPLLVEIIGPYQMFPFLSFSGALRTLWVATVQCMPRVEWSLLTAFAPSCHILPLRSLSLLGWQPSALPFHDLLALCPHLTEVSLHLDSTQSFSTSDLASCGQALATTSIARICILGCKLSGSSMEHVVLAWKEWQPSLVEARVSPTLCWTWGGGPLTTARLNSLQPSVPAEYEVVYRLGSRYTP